METVEGLGHSPELGKLATALAKAQAEMKPAGEDSTNPHFRSKYASLSSCLEAAKPLARHGIAVAQVPNHEAGCVELITMLIHTESGQWIRGRWPIDTAKGVQGMGSALTYARRYCLCAMAGIASGDADDDGNAAQQAPRAAPRPQAKATPAAPTDWMGRLDSAGTMVERAQIMNEAQQALGPCPELVTVRDRFRELAQQGEAEAAPKGIRSGRARG